MPIAKAPNSVIAGGRAIPFADFTTWHDHHIHQVAGTQQLEQQGAAIAAEGFQFPQLVQFIREVCRWGGYAGIAGRVLNQNTPHQIVGCFGNTALAFGGHHPAAAALGTLNHLRGLGTPSFSSKHLRFLRPDICPVLDRLLSRSLGYPFTVGGYQQFSTDCCTVAQRLNAGGVILPTQTPWGAADVEMSIFACLHLNP